MASPTGSEHSAHLSSLEAQKTPQLEIPRKDGVAPQRASQIYSAGVPRQLRRMPHGGRLREVGLATPKPLTPPATESSSSDALSTSRGSATPSTDAQVANAPIQQSVAALPNFRSVQDLSQIEERSPHKMGRYVSQVSVDARYNAEDELKTAGKGRVGRERIYLITAVVAINFMFIFATWRWPMYYYIYLPFITITVFLNSVMVCSLALNAIRFRIWKPKKLVPAKPEDLVYLLPCYNETPEELTKSLDSLVDQVNIDQHRKAVIIIVDGRVRGPGMDKTSGEFLLDDLLLDRKSRHYIKNAYITWTHEQMDVEVQQGVYRGLPYYCIVKQQNQGKRDSLIVLRSFLYKYNLRSEKPKVILSPRLFGEMAAFLASDAEIPHADCLIGMDGDTIFEHDCVSELLKESRYPNTVGVCGYVSVDFTGSQWGLWNLYQSAEYTISQGLRRLHQSTVTNKVSCLPGCCQLLKVCETTCGDKILLDLFGYCPKPTDSLLKHTRATASEDRNHVCLMLSAFPKAQTRQALRARAYTDVPHSWSVFLSQRRRWTLGATSNDLFLAFAPGIYWFERILAIANCLVWFINIFVFASLGALIAAILFVEGWVIMCFASVMLVPVTYYICIIFWLPRTLREKAQYALGCLMYICGGPIINIMVLFYALYYVDSFGWGKTRKVIADSTVPNKVAVPVDEEKEVGLRSTGHPRPQHDSVVILGDNPYAMQLLKACAPHYHTTVFDPSEDFAERARGYFSGTEDYSVKITSDEEELARANVYLITSPFLPTPTGSPHGPTTLQQVVEIVSRYIKPSDIVMIETAASVGTTRDLLMQFEFRGVFTGYSPAPSVNSMKRTFTDGTKMLSVLNAENLHIIERFYQRIFAKTVALPSPESAEMFHLLETALQHSQGIVETKLESPPDAVELQTNLRRVSSLWKAFLIETESGLDVMPSKVADNVMDKGKAVTDPEQDLDRLDTKLIESKLSRRHQEVDSGYGSMALLTEEVGFQKNCELRDTIDEQPSMPMSVH
ncbi:hypothetical protein LTR10_021726 [Elasticomyces elasticus]|uniref:chitin synthase n=1 Tax=Exophiala sideris TaxID=1016849 RepID=A0ABR0JDX5_9EURO|nr:hypothetical protein LTR10_021726 [Elasticomyces elasticus]KAK5032524.1 hypothetical protein LTS07_003932 [Exophiala sideris]KAK5037298.1 hypothetical protein LTR13_005104 [Exophiala sideris]KAK5062048.1 hypothetical protein LTR69_004405 [Exophiala sideris]KAK5182456.1 hypothetical protein LTR44_005468 [Eurotiomycetes sp. CCFEE 6388]